MKKSIRNVVIRPAGYKSQGNSFPVLYLLHGADGNYRDWISNVPVTPRPYTSYVDPLIGSGG